MRMHASLCRQLIILQGAYIRSLDTYFILSPIYHLYVLFVEILYQARFCSQISYPAILFTMLMGFLMHGVYCSHPFCWEQARCDGHTMIYVYMCKCMSVCVCMCMCQCDVCICVVYLSVCKFVIVSKCVYTMAVFTRGRITFRKTFGSRSKTWLGSRFELRVFTCLANAFPITIRICALRGNILLLLRSPRALIDPCAYAWLQRAFLMHGSRSERALRSHVLESGFLGGSRSKTPFFSHFKSRSKAWFETALCSPGLKSGFHIRKGPNHVLKRLSERDSFSCKQAHCILTYKCLWNYKCACLWNILWVHIFIGNTLKQPKI